MYLIKDLVHSIYTQVTREKILNNFKKDSNIIVCDSIVKIKSQLIIYISFLLLFKLITIIYAVCEVNCFLITTISHNSTFR